MEYLEVAISGLILILLLVEAYFDIFYKMVNIWHVILISALVLPLRILLCIQSEVYIPYIAGIIPGMICYVMSKLLKESIGEGDIVLSLLIGMTKGFESTMYILLTAFLMSAIYGSLLLILKRRRKSETLAFVPFLAGSYTLEISLLMPLILTVIFLCIFYGIYVHDKEIIEYAGHVSLMYVMDSDDFDVTDYDEKFDAIIKKRTIGNWDIEKYVDYEESASEWRISLVSKMHIREGTLSLSILDKLFTYKTEYAFNIHCYENEVREYALED